MIMSRVQDSNANKLVFCVKCKSTLFQVYSTTVIVCRDCDTKYHLYEAMRRMTIDIDKMGLDIHQNSEWRMEEGNGKAEEARVPVGV